MNFYKNHEGYYDPTAGIALGSIEKAERKEVATMKVKKGEIYEYELKNGNVRHVLIVSNQNGSYVNGAFLADPMTMKNRQPTDVDVLAKVPMVAKISGLTNLESNQCISYIKTITEEELEVVNRALAEQFGFHPESYDILKNKIQELKAELELAKNAPMPADYDSLKNSNAELAKAVEEYEEAYVKLKVENGNLLEEVNELRGIVHDNKKVKYLAETNAKTRSEAESWKKRYDVLQKMCEKVLGI